MVTALIITCLALMAAHVAVEVVEIVYARRRDMEELAQVFLEADEKEAITEANQRYDDQMFKWFASIAKNMADMQKDIKRIADRAEHEPPIAEPAAPVYDGESERRQAAIEEGIQNILNYGFAQAIKRGDGD